METNELQPLLTQKGRQRKLLMVIQAEAVREVWLTEKQIDDGNKTSQMESDVSWEGKGTRSEHSNEVVLVCRRQKFWIAKGLR